MLNNLFKASLILGTFAINTSISNYTANASTLIPVTEIKSVPFPVPLLPPVQINIETLIATDFFLTSNPPKRIFRPNLEIITFNGGIPIPFFNQYYLEIPDPPILASVITDEPTIVTSVMTTGTENLFTGFQDGIVSLDSATIFGVSGKSYNGSIQSVASENIETVLPTGADVSMFDQSPGQTYFVSQFTIPTDDFCETVPEPSIMIGLIAYGLLGGVSIIKRAFT